MAEMISQHNFVISLNTDVVHMVYGSETDGKWDACLVATGCKKNYSLVSMTKSSQAMIVMFQRKPHHHHHLSQREKVLSSVSS